MHQVIEPIYAELLQRPNRRHIQRLRERHICRHRPPIGAIEILGPISGVLSRNIRHERVRQDLPAIQHRRVQERLENAAGAARPPHDVDRESALVAR